MENHLYLELAGSRTPLDGAAADALLALARRCADGPHPVEVPVRENRAILNRVAVEGGRAPTVDTVTDVLRLAAALADGDHVLQVPPRFPSFSRGVRRVLLQALEDVVASSPAKLGDVHRHREIWKRLGERLHAGSYREFRNAARVFAVARGEATAPTLAARIEAAFASGELDETLDALSVSPGLLVRNADRTLRSFSERGLDPVIGAIEQALPNVSARVVLALREHLLNRDGDSSGERVFVNRSGGGWVVPDVRTPLDSQAVAELARTCDAEILRRMPRPVRVVVDPEMLDVAVPISGRSTSGGFGSLPRGSRTPVDAHTLRFFVYWKQAVRRTDLDLSCLLLDADFTNAEHVSWTRLSGDGFVHSGDITEAPNGASEFLDVDSAAVGKDVVVPQVLVYDGERFDELAEAFFGYMARHPDQKGQPFEPQTVKMKSALSGMSRVVIPLVFVRDGGGWTAIWLHLQQRGRGSFNTVEAGRATTTSLVRAIVDRRYLTVRYLTSLLTSAGVEVDTVAGRPLSDAVTYIGLTPRDDLLAGSVIITPQNLGALIPE